MRQRIFLMFPPSFSFVVFLSIVFGLILRFRITFKVRNRRDYCIGRGA